MPLYVPRQFCSSVFIVMLCVISESEWEGSLVNRLAWWTYQVLTHGYHGESRCLLVSSVKGGGGGGGLVNIYKFKLA